MRECPLLHPEGTPRYSSLGQVKRRREHHRYSSSSSSGCRSGVRHQSVVPGIRQHRRIRVPCRTRARPVAAARLSTRDVLWILERAARQAAPSSSARHHLRGMIVVPARRIRAVPASARGRSRSIFLSAWASPRSAPSDRRHPRTWRRRPARCQHQGLPHALPIRAWDVEDATHVHRRPAGLTIA